MVIAMTLPCLPAEWNKNLEMWQFENLKMFVSPSYEIVSLSLIIANPHLQINTSSNFQII